MNDFMKAQFTDFETWALNNKIENKCLRYWIKGVNDDSTCFYGFIRHLIKMPNGTLMVGLAAYNEDKENNMYPSLDYYNWDDLHFCWCESDEE